MTDILFFPKTVAREIRIRNFTGLVGKAPEKAKRIKLSLSMPLSDRTMVGMPGWLGDAFEFVSKTHDTVTLNLEFPGADIELSADDIFKKTAKAPKAKLSKFSIVTTGDEENPDVEAQFSAHVPYSSGFLTWVGQFVGDEVWARFDLIGGGSVADGKAAAAGSDDEDEEDEPTEEENKLFAGDRGEMDPAKDALYTSPATKPRGSRGRIQ